MNRLVACVTLSALSVTGCGPLDDVDIHAVGRLDYGGRVERIETLGRYSSLDAILLAQVAGAPGEISAESNYFLYRVTYLTAGVDGEPTPVSGLVAVPANRDIKGVVSWQHGTNTFRQESISKPTLLEGLGTSAIFAGDGFLMVAADYVGLGVSTAMHPYYHLPSTASAVIDLLSIARIMLDGIARNPDGDLYLAGFSQGGGATAAVQKSLQESNPTGLELRGAATVAAAFNLRDISLHFALETDNILHFAYLLAAHSQISGESLDGIVQDPYKEQLAAWFDGTKNQDFLDQQLPELAEEFFAESFLRDYRAGEENPQWFYDVLDRAGTYDYSPEAPLRIYFGNSDAIVTPDEARAAFIHMQALGGSVEMVDLGPYGHDESTLQALPQIQGWFDRLERNAGETNPR